jgi:hypothetical protein
MLVALVHYLILFAAAPAVLTECDTAEECASDDHNSTMLLQVQFEMEGRKVEQVAANQPATSQSSVRSGGKDVGATSSVLATCSQEQFQSALAWLIDSKLIKESNITSLAQTEYLKIAERQRCEVGPEWQLSEKPIIVDVGEGSTATHLFHVIMMDLGFESVHWYLNNSEDREANESVPFLKGRKEAVNGTADVDQWEALSDSPVAYLTWQFLKSHPNALFVMSMRDPTEWHANRMRKHPYPGYDGNAQAIPCGDSLDMNLTFMANTAAQTYVAYSAWAACVLPADRLITVNVFENENNVAQYTETLISYLEAHGLQKPNWENRTAHVRACARRIESPVHDDSNQPQPCSDEYQR